MSVTERRLGLLFAKDLVGKSPAGPNVIIVLILKREWGGVLACHVSAYKMSEKVKKTKRWMAKEVIYTIDKTALAAFISTDPSLHFVQPECGAGVWLHQNKK